jgi:hypothetical protein
MKFGLKVVEYFTFNLSDGLIQKNGIMFCIINMVSKDNICNIDLSQEIYLKLGFFLIRN